MRYDLRITINEKGYAGAAIVPGYSQIPIVNLKS